MQVSHVPSLIQVYKVCMMNVGKQLQQKSHGEKCHRKSQGKSHKKRIMLFLTLRKLAHAINTDFFNFKNCKFSAENFGYFSYFCSKNRLWVTSTHYLCFGAKIRKIGLPLPLHTPVFLYERGV